MRAIKQAIIEIVVLLAIGLALGFSVNAVRGAAKGLGATIKPQHNYFAFREAPAQAAAPSGEATTERRQLHIRKHAYYELTFDEAADLFLSEENQAEAYVWVDARNDDDFEEGHIVGAIQCDHYQLENYLDAVLEYAAGAEKVIVYCNGGECEDSILVCQDLEDAGVPKDLLYLYADGWSAWAKNDMPYEGGG